MARELAARRAALLAQCAEQRAALRNQASEAIAPLAQARGIGLSNLKIPLTIGGVVLGLIVSSPKRAMAIISTGLTVWRVASTVLASLRETRHPGEGRDPSSP